MGGIRDLASGVRGLAAYFEALGIPAKVLEKGDPDWLDKGLVSQDAGYVRLEKRNVALVAVRLSGTVRNEAQWQGSMEMGGLTVATVGRDFFPVRYHHIVREDPGADPGAYKAKLKRETKGLLKREVVGVRWEGGTLADRLNGDAGSTRAAFEALRPKENLWVAPDEKRKCVRIVEEGMIDVRYQFPASFNDILRVDRGFPSRGLLDSIERIASHVLALEHGSAR